MKSAAFLTVVLVFLVACPRAECDRPKEADVELRALSERFLDSLVQDDFVAYSQCWISFAVAWRAATRAGAPLDESDDGPPRVLGRNRLIAKLFAPLRDRLKALSRDMTAIKVEAVTTERHEVCHGQDVWDEFAVFIRVGSDSIVRIEVGRVGNVGDDWYLLDRPSCKIDVVKDGVCKELDLLTGKEDEWFPAPGLLRDWMGRGSKQGGS